ncbi:MAG: phosphonate C-P lyase system protein PhnH [Pseudomonadota bacterium]
MIAALIAHSASPDAGSTGALAALPRGFADPVHGSQTTFRCLLEAMARPGCVQALDADTRDALAPPRGLGVATTAILLTVADADTAVWLSPAFAPAQVLEGVLAFGRFHTGMRVVPRAEESQYAFAPAHAAAEALLLGLPRGSDEAPQEGATLIVEAPSIVSVEEDAAAAAPPAHPEDADPTPWVRLSGPGVRHARWLAVGGLSLAFWRAREELQAGFPRGVDIVFTCGGQIAAVPRSTVVQRSR